MDTSKLMYNSSNILIFYANESISCISHGIYKEFTDTSETYFMIPYHLYLIFYLPYHYPCYTIILGNVQNYHLWSWGTYTTPLNVKPPSYAILYMVLRYVLLYSN